MPTRPRSLPPPVAPPAGLADPVAPGGAVGAGAAGRPGVALAVAVVVVLVAELLVRALAAGSPPPLRVPDHVTAVRVERMAAHGPVDVVFAGTSMAWQGLVPSAFTAADPAGRSAFNAGLDGAVPVVTGPWLRSHVEPALSPRTVVWGLSTLDLAPAYGDVQAQAWRSSPAGRPGPLGAVQRWAADRSALIAHRAQLRRPGHVDDPSLATTVTDAQAMTGPDGRRIGLTGDRTGQGAAVHRARLGGFTPDRTDLEAIAATVLVLQDRGVDVVLAELPVPPAFVGLHPRGAADVDRAREAMAVLADELGVPLLPTADGWADTDFVDWTHLTDEAATRFTARVAADLPVPVVAAGAEAGRSAGDGNGGAAGRATDETADTTPVQIDVTTAPATAGAAADRAVEAASGAGPADPTAEDPAVPAEDTPSTGDGTAATTPPPPPPPPPAPSTATTDWIGGRGARAVAEVVRLAAVDQLGCTGGALPPDPAAAARDGAAQLADRDLAATVLAVVDRAEQLAGACTDPPTWSAAMTALLEGAEELARRVEAVLGVAPTGEGAVARAVAGATAGDLAVFAAHAHDRLHWLLSGAGHPRLARNPVWWSFAQRGHVDLLLRMAQAGQGTDTVVFGTSQARTGLPADQLSAATRRTAVNVAIDGGTVDVAAEWARDFVLDVLRPSRAVVVVSGVDVLTSVGPPCPASSLERFRGSMAVARASFTAVPWLSAPPMGLAAAADGPTAAPPLRSPLVDGYQAGDEEDYRRRSDEEAIRQGRPYLAAYESFTYCPERFDALERLVADMTGRGIDVLVVAAPVRSELREIAPPGTVANLDRSLQQVAEGAGGRFRSATALVADGDMIDLIHLSQQGAAQLVDHVAAGLEMP